MDAGRPARRRAPTPHRARAAGRVRPRLARRHGARLGGHTRYRDSPVRSARAWPRGANLPFCRWFSRLRRPAADVRVMFHEPYFYFTWRRPWSPSNGLAVVQRLMARALLGGAGRVYYSDRNLAAVSAERPRRTLAIPSSVPDAVAAEAIARQRAAATNGQPQAPLVGHFGTYGAHRRRRALHDAAGAHRPSAAAPSRAPRGRWSGFPARLAADASRARRPQPRPQAASTPRRWRRALRACDVLLQPYPDGITTRRTSAMAGLRSGVATVSSNGPFTESRVGRNRRGCAGPGRRRAGDRGCGRSAAA